MNKQNIYFSLFKDICVIGSDLVDPELKYLIVILAVFTILKEYLSKATIGIGVTNV